MSPVEDAESLRDGPLEVALDERLARVNGSAVSLTDREFELLVAMMRRAGRVIRREDLFREVWGADLRRGDRSVDVYVFKLRNKLEQALPGWSFIHTHTGWGYRLKPEWQSSPPAVPTHRTDVSIRRVERITSRRDHDRPHNHVQGRNR